MPTHNRQTMLERAIASVVAQTYQQWELIVVDDGSRQPVEAALRANFSAFEKQIQVIRHDQPQGACAARNSGVRAAKGKWLTSLDDDDEYYPDRLRHQLEVLSTHPEFAFVCTDYLDIRTTGQRISKKGGVMDVNRVLWSNITTPSVLARTADVLKIGGWDENLTAAQDYDLYLRLLLEYGKAYRIPKALYIHHQEHLGPRITNNPRKRFRGYYDFYLKHKQLMNRDQRAFFLYMLLGVQQKSRTICQLLHWVPLRFFPSELNNIFLEKTKLYRWLGPK